MAGAMAGPMLGPRADATVGARRRRRLRHCRGRKRRCSDADEGGRAPLPIAAVTRVARPDREAEEIRRQAGQRAGQPAVGPLRPPWLWPAASPRSDPRDQCSCGSAPRSRSRAGPGRRLLGSRRQSSLGCRTPAGGSLRSARPRPRRPERRGTRRRREGRRAEGRRQTRRSARPRARRRSRGR